MEFDFKPSGEHYLTDPTPLDEELEVRDERNELKPLQIMLPDIGKKILGVHIAPDGITKDKFSALMKKVEKWVRT